MSSLPPNSREGLMKGAATPAGVNMAVAQPTKTKATSKASNNTNNNATQKTKTQMHRRSRTGWCSLSFFLVTYTHGSWVASLTLAITWPV